MAFLCECHLPLASLYQKLFCDVFFSNVVQINVGMDMNKVIFNCYEGILGPSGANKTTLSCFFFKN